MLKVAALFLSLMLFSGTTLSATALWAENDLIIADFESWPTNLGGEVGVYGSLEPTWSNNPLYSWVYEPPTPNYSMENVHTGRQSFRLVTGLDRPDETWGSFAMDLGPLIDLTVFPKKVESFNASSYKYLTFWLKGENGGEKAVVLFRDAHAVNYKPQAKYKTPDATTDWQKIVVPLSEIKDQVDLTKLDNIGIAFGPDVGNKKGSIAYLDDFAFTNNK